MKRIIEYCLVVLALCSAQYIQAQTIYEYKRDDADLFFFSKGLSQYVPHIVRAYEGGKAFHTGIWDIDTTGRSAIQPPMIMVMDWMDNGNGGASSIPKNIISIEMAPLDFSYFIAPSVSRYYHLFRHEYTHVTMTDKTASSDRMWRSFLGGKFTVEPLHPFSAAWSFLAAPRWYAPRWYHEGIACFMETWLNGGVGRALGSYDEMYFRSIVDSGEPLWSVVGLETEGTVSDFQVGTNSYLYGTRFVNYLEYTYGLDKLLSFYNRTEDSKRLFNRQFNDVYGLSLRRAWDDWRDFEVEHQKTQIASIEEYPITETEDLFDKAMGSMSPMAVDWEKGYAYAAVNYPGDFAHVEQFDLNTLKRKKLFKIDGSQMYQTAFITLDTKRQRLFVTSQNNDFRGLQVYDLNRNKIVKKLTFQRVSSIQYDNAGDYLYGLMTSQGKVYLIRYDSELEDKEILYSFPFGLSVFDLSVSHNGKKLTVTTSGDNGEQNLLYFDVDSMSQGKFNYETLYTLEDSNLGQFQFAPGDSVLVGSSYYTGVSNIWSLDIKSKEMNLLSNARIGLFSPVVKDDGTIYALEFERNGMKPVRFVPEVLHDANSVEMLGQRAYEKHSQELESLATSRIQAPNISFGEVFDSIKVYNPVKNLKFTGAFPEISGFTDRSAWNHVTPVLGYRFTFQDPLGLNSIKMSIGLSPWSNNDKINQYHAQFEWKFWAWKLNASFNPTSFYDLAGPMRSSRKGWQVSLSYDKVNKLLTPRRIEYGASIAAYGMMDALPLYQEIETQDITSFQTASAYYTYRRTRSTLGAVVAEQGFVAGVNAYTYLAGGKFYNSATGSFDVGFLIPGLKNTCFWLRSAVGQNFGSASSIFGNDYFGGFGNNWIDYREANRYRRYSSLPGAGIDSIKGHCFGRVMGELNLKPIRFNNFGGINLYPTYSQLSFFSTGLVTDPWAKGNSDRQTKLYVNAGVQLNTEVVLFKFLKTTWSLGYARVFYPDGTSGGDWLFSLKLL